MSHMRKVHEHMDEAAGAHRQSHEEALRQAAVARAQAEAAMIAEDPTEPSGEVVDGG